MTEKEKTVFKMMSSYINKMGCDNAEIDGEFWAEEYFSGRHFNCKSGGSYKFPFDPSDVLNNWFDSLDLDMRSYEDEGMNSFWLEINPKENSVSVIAGFSEIEMGETQIITQKLSENLDLDKLKNKLKENFGEFKQIQVTALCSTHDSRRFTITWHNHLNQSVIEFLLVKQNP
jgi:hypothetical protein